MTCKRCKGTETIWNEGSIHGEDICPDCAWLVYDENLKSTYPPKKGYYEVKEVLLQIRYEEPITTISKDYWNGEQWGSRDSKVLAYRKIKE